MTIESDPFAELPTEENVTNFRPWPTAADNDVRYNAGVRDGQAIHKALYGEWPA
jgi:hypothetical protein